MAEESAFKAPAARPMNRSFDWMGTRGSWFVFVIAIAFFHYMFCLLLNAQSAPENYKAAWNYTVYVHCALQFYVMHWVKGTMDASDQGRFMDQTWWEQIDGGIPWTATRKFLVCLNLVLFLVVSYETNYDHQSMIINGILIGILTIAKLPELQGVRIFGINQ
eukprot:CAMPEP_0195526640 /NCGR_PEP_ID=MMETSP0794_2-20130614/27819_1 /TAXON_ID=515487 /ORGANISM="Stephanopyxis turris, Strain CCMP 815" /LENGTH=161 /DNA_ID=CAMNT_0040657377 /DNA_START=47 /DNA_END=532 /DNA_ORIENTATION=+